MEEIVSYVMCFATIAFIFIICFKANRWSNKYNRINKTHPPYKVGDCLRRKSRNENPFSNDYYLIGILDIKQNHKGEYYVKYVYKDGSMVETTATAYLIYDMFDTNNIIK